MAILGGCCSVNRGKDDSESVVEILLVVPLQLDVCCRGNKAFFDIHPLWCMVLYEREQNNCRGSEFDRVARPLDVGELRLGSWVLWSVSSRNGNSKQ